MSAILEDEPLHTVQGSHRHPYPQAAIWQFLSLFGRVNPCSLTNPPSLIFVEDYLDLDRLLSPDHPEAGAEIILCIKCPVELLIRDSQFADSPDMEIALGATFMIESDQIPFAQIIPQVQRVDSSMREFTTAAV